MHLTYECSAEAGTTRFVRTLDYRFDGFALRIVNRLLLKRRIERESAASLLALRDMATQYLASARTHA